MIAVLDASIAVKIVLESDIRNAFSQQQNDIEWLLAPDLFIAEVSNVFWKYHRFQHLPTQKCLHLIDSALALVDDFVSAKSLNREAFQLAAESEITVYDALYLVLSRRNGATLFSADQKLIQVAEQHRILHQPI